MNKRSQLKAKATLTARTVAELPMNEGFGNSGEGHVLLSKTVGRLAKDDQRCRMIVVLDMNRIRLTHPIRNESGPFQIVEYEVPAFTEHLERPSKAKGEIGTVIRKSSLFDHEIVSIGKSGS